MCGLLRACLAQHNTKQQPSVKRDLLQRQKRPTIWAKETYYKGKRDLAQHNRNQQPQQAEDAEHESVTLCTAHRATKQEHTQCNAHEALQEHIRNTSGTS